MLFFIIDFTESVCSFVFSEKVYWVPQAFSNTVMICTEIWNNHLHTN